MADLLNVTRKMNHEGIAIAADEIQAGDQIRIPVEGFGTFTATAEKMATDSVLFIFDDIITMQPMNETDTNEGGFKGSHLYKWLQDTLLPAFPENLRSMISELTIPTVGQIVGHENEWDNEHFERDEDEQLPLMKNPKHRAALFKDGFSWYWVQNSTKKEWSSAYFAVVFIQGNAAYASDFCGVRPAFWLVKDTDMLKKCKEDDAAAETETIRDSFVDAGFTVRIPCGYLIVEKKCSESEYPGVFISFSPDGLDHGEIVACIEYDSCAEEIRTEVYRSDAEEPVSIIRYRK